MSRRNPIRRGEKADDRIADSADDPLISAIAHELKTPLAVIAGYAELLRVRDDEETRREGPKCILEAAERLSSALDELLALLASDSKIARRLVEAHEAAAEADGRPEGSSSLSLGLASAEPRSELGARKIVIIDDDESVRSLLRMTLPVDGFKITEARDGQEGLEVVDGETPDLVLLDWRMPGRSGAEVLKELKRRHPELPVIVLTAENKQRSRQVAESIGADSFVTKPFSPLELLDLVEHLTR